MSTYAYEKASAISRFIEATTGFSTPEAKGKGKKMADDDACSASPSSEGTGMQADLTPSSETSPSRLGAHALEPTMGSPSNKADRRLHAGRAAPGLPPPSSTRWASRPVPFWPDREVTVTANKVDDATRSTFGDQHVAGRARWSTRPGDKMQAGTPPPRHLRLQGAQTLTPGNTPSSNQFHPMISITGNGGVNTAVNAVDKMLAGFSPGYMGNIHLPRNKSADIPEDQNCSLFMLGLPETLTTHELLSNIRDAGRVFASHINGPEVARGHYTSAAKVIFFDRASAERFFDRHRDGFSLTQYPEHAPAKVVWNRIRTAEQSGPGTATKSRVLMIRGPASLVNEADLDRYFRTKFQYQKDHVIMHRFVPQDNIALVEFRFGSYRCQAESAKMALMREWAEYGVQVWYGDDPCAIGVRPTTGPPPSPVTPVTRGPGPTIGESEYFPNPYPSTLPYPYPQPQFWNSSRTHAHAHAHAFLGPRAGVWTPSPSPLGQAQAFRQATSASPLAAVGGGRSHRTANHRASLASTDVERPVSSPSGSKSMPRDDTSVDDEGLNQAAEYIEDD